MRQTTPVKQIKNILPKGRFIISLLLTLSLWPHPKLAQAQWATSGNDIYNTNTGNIGIGSGSSFTPVEKLDVRGNLNLGTVGLSSTLKIYSSANTGTGSYGTILTRSSGGIEITGGGGSAATENAFYVTAYAYPGLDNTYSLGSTSLRWSNLQVGTGTSSFAGKVGIGTTTPDQTLHVHKGSAGTVSSDSFSVLTLENNDHVTLQMLSPNNKTEYIFFGDVDNNDVGQIRYSHSDNALSFVTNTSQRMIIDSSGKVGIGTATPRQQLDVAGGGIELDNNQSIYWRNAANSADVNLMRLDSTNTVVFGPTTGSVFPDYEFNEGFSSIPTLRIKGGNVGIGRSTDPTVGMLEVGGSIVLYSDASNKRAGIAGVDRGSGAGGLGFSTLTAGTFTGKMEIDNIGNVGIPTINSSAKLYIEETSNNTAKAGLRIINNGTPTIGYGLHVTKVGAAGNNIAGYFSASGGTNNYGLIVENGNVGIGTDTPARKLHITDAMRLAPIASAPSSASSGDLYFDSSEALCVWVNGAWSKIAGTGTCS